MFQEGEEIFLTQDKFSQGDDAGDVPDLPAFFDLLDSDDVLPETAPELDNSLDIDDDLVAWAESIERQQVGTDGGKKKENVPSRIGRIVTDKEIQSIGVKSDADNTKKKMRWAVNTFNKWVTERNEIAKRDPQSNISVIVPSLTEMTKDKLCFAVSRFLCEVIKENGEDYPGETLYEIVINIQMYLEQCGRIYKFLNDEAFLQIKNTLDHVMKQRSASGLGIDKKKTQIISLEEEELLWQRWILGNSTPQRLLDTVLYLFGLHFALRAAKEHRNLRMKQSQVTLIEQNGDKFLKYTEDVSKSNQGRIRTRKIKQKVVYAFEDKTNLERCIVRLYSQYTQHCPEQRKGNSFYLRPLTNPRENIWYSLGGVGINALSSTVGRMCTEAGLTGFRSNHSVRATAATRLYECGVDEQVIAEITGHRSDAVREYKRTNESMRKEACSIIRGGDYIPKRSLSVQRETTDHSVSKRVCIGEKDLDIHINVNVNCN